MTNKDLAKALHSLLISVDLATMSHRDKDQRGIDVHLATLNKKYSDKRKEIQAILDLLQEKPVMEKEYAGFESLNDLNEDVSDGGALFDGMKDIEGEYQGTLKVTVTYKEEES